MTRSFTAAAAALAGLAALAAPGNARAQALGEVTTAAGEDIYLNATECEPSQAKALDLRWWVSVPGGVLGSGIYRVYATNTAPAATGTGPKLCETEDNTTASPAVYAAQVGSDITAAATDTRRTGTFDSWAFPLAANKVCTETGDQTIYVCVHFFPYTSGTTPAAEPTGSATGSLILSTARPSAPISLALRVGDTRLYASWTQGAGGATAQKYEAVATPLAEVGLPDGQRPGERRTTTTDTKATLDRLVNGTEYQVVVYALSVSGTRSDASVAATGTPRPVKDFWEIYKDGAGAEQGGCGGPGGPLALLGVAAALALLAGRRKP
jgi:hypothetical protein